MNGYYEQDGGPPALPKWHTPGSVKDTAKHPMSSCGFLTQVSAGVHASTHSHKNKDILNEQKN